MVLFCLFILPMYSLSYTNERIKLKNKKIK